MMNYLYAPWRSPYVLGEEMKKNTESDKQACVFCQYIGEDNDEENLIVHRFDYHVIMLNKYPYNLGHILIVPYVHEQSIESLSPNVRGELVEAIAHCSSLLKKTFQPEGINIGMNMGKSAGASIVDHLHVHILPRWQGDTNFLPLIANTRHISFDLQQTYKTLRNAFSLE